MKPMDTLTEAEIDALITLPELPDFEAERMEREVPGYSQSIA
jgi:hypothetical protein